MPRSTAPGYRNDPERRCPVDFDRLGKRGRRQFGCDQCELHGDAVRRRNVDRHRRYGTGGGTATAGTDYTTTSGTLTFTPGQTQQTISVPVIGDALNEPNETFQVTLSNPTNATIASGSATGTITNDDGVPQLSIGNASVTEGNSSSVTAPFTVTLSAASGQTVTVGYATAAGTAAAGSDFTTTAGTLTFAPGTTTQTINVPVLPDTIDEANETFTVGLSNATNATISTTTGTGTIVDNDTAPSLSIGNTSVTEGNSGTVNATLTVTLSAASGQTVTVNYATADGSATSPADYTSTSGTLSFSPGQTSKTITVGVKGDTLDEANDTINVDLSNPANATIADSQGVITVNDDDATPSLSINNISVTGELRHQDDNLYGDALRRQRTLRHRELFDGQRHGVVLQRLQFDLWNPDICGGRHDTDDYRDHPRRHVKREQRNVRDESV